MIGTDSKSFGSNRSTLKEVVQELDEISICQGHYSSSSILNDSKLFVVFVPSGPRYEQNCDCILNQKFFHSRKKELFGNPIFGISGYA